MNTIAYGEEDIAALRARIALANKFAWIMVSGLTAICYRERGEKALNEIWSTLLSSEQKVRFQAALVKLGIQNDPPALAAAKYHYFSNSIGGLNMQLIEETPKKVWIRYLSPWGTYPGIAALTVPTSVRRTILSTWHPRNGGLLGCPRLGWVATKFVAEGHPYDEGYFQEYDHDLAPEERFRVEHVERSPEFDPDRAPKLDPAIWPEARWLKGSYSYGVDYVQHTIEIMHRLFGAPAARDLVATGMRLLAVQFGPDLAKASGEEGASPAAIAASFAAILRAFRNDCSLDAAQADRAVLRIRGFLPFAHEADDGLREAVFALFAMMTRLRNGHVAISRHFDAGSQTETWTLSDEERWLW
ncbi:hypothetical protein LJR009_004132 [Bosea sp. LjRoot9]|uniref:hypothetical protein n=1 Tax=Bosea sp. LjRoot9 TaxID=3342341 RepID=UPI003ECDFF81